MAVELACYRHMRRLCPRSFHQYLCGCCSRMQVPVETDESMPSVTERPMPSKGRIVAQPGPVWKTNCISTGVATRVTCNVPVDAVARTSALPLLLRCGGTNEQPTAALPEHVSCCRCQAQCLQGQHFWSVVVLSTPEGPPWLVDARHRSSPKLQLAKAQEQSMPESQARGEMSQDVCCMRGCSQGKNGAEESHPEGLLLTGYPSPMPVALAARFVSWNVCVWISYLPSPGRSKAQRRLVVGSSRTVSNAAQRRDDIPHLMINVD